MTSNVTGTGVAADAEVNKHCTVALNKVQGKKNGTELWKRDYYRP